MTGKPVQDQPVRGRYMDELRRLVLEFLGDDDVAVYLFGSRARGDNDPGSDVDIGILPRGPLPRGRLALLKSELEESNVPYRVEIVNLAEVSQEFRRHAMKDAVAWKI